MARPNRLSFATPSCTAVLAAPIVRLPNPVPGEPPVIAAKPALPAEVTIVMPTSSIASVNWSSTSRPAKNVGPPGLMLTTSIFSESKTKG
jgi:hypothetical protein